MRVATVEKAVATEETAQDAATWAIANFKNSQAFANEVTKGSTKAYQLGFANCKAQVAQLYPEIDLSKFGKKVKEELAANPTKPKAALEVILEPAPSNANN